MDEFLHKAFLEIFITEDLTQSDISQTKNLINSAQEFINVVKGFGNINYNKGFIEMIIGDINAYESLTEEEEKADSEVIYFSTPEKYLLGSIKPKVIILTSISSKNWSPRIIKEMTNNQVLAKSWDLFGIYTEKQEEENQKLYLATLMRAILRSCQDKLITFESNLSANGFENDGKLSEYFDTILN
jgi:hypothetical protein